MDHTDDSSPNAGYETNSIHDFPGGTSVAQSSSSAPSAANWSRATNDFLFACNTVALTFSLFLSVQFQVRVRERSAGDLGYARHRGPNNPLEFKWSK